MTFLRSLFFSLGMVGATLIYAPLALLTFPLPLRHRYRIITSWSLLIIWWLRVTCRIGFRVEGAENIGTTPAIVFAKHQSTWETLALQKIFPPQVWLLKRELLWVPLFGWGLAMLRPIAIDRRTGRKAVSQLVEQGHHHLREGRWVIIFPEGTRVAPGASGRYGIGGAVLAERTGCPVIPVAHNAGTYWPRRGFIKRAGTIQVVIGPPIESRGRSADQIRSAARAWIEATTQAIEAGEQASARARRLAGQRNEVCNR